MPWEPQISQYNISSQRCTQAYVCRAGLTTTQTGRSLWAEFFFGGGGGGGNNKNK
jgi:hypothetical protein